MHTPAFRLLLACLLGIPALTPAHAQTPVGRRTAVSGTVTDVSGAVLPGATVEVLVAGVPIAETTTGPDGRYRLEIEPGAGRELRVRKEGFAERVLDLRAGSDPAVADVALAPAAFADSIVVTASRVPERRSTASEAIDVFTARDAQALGAASLADLVRFAPGVAVETNGREGALASLFSRGGESDYNLVLIDGVRVNASGGGFDFSRVAAAEIDRVEVVRGAQSALYGSDAMGSVVQLFTRRAAPADPVDVAGSVEGGTFGTWRGDVRLLGGARQRLDYHAGVAFRRTEGAFRELLPEADRFRQTSLDAGAGTIVGDRATVRGGLRYSAARGRDVGPIDFGSRNTGTRDDTDDLSWHVDATHRLSPAITQAASAAYAASDRVSADTIVDPTYYLYAILEGTPGALFPNGPRLVRFIDQASFARFQSGAQQLPAGQFLATTPFGVSDFPYTSETRFRRAAARYQIDGTWADRQVLSAGYEFERETDPLNPGFLVRNHAAFVQQRLEALDRLFLTFGARLDHHSQYGTAASPKLGAAFLLVPYGRGALSSLKLTANAGRGIKNPSFGELYGSAFVDGNPNLRPERARTIDVGGEATFAAQRLFGRAVYFNNTYRDQVAFRATAFERDGLPDYLNIDGSEAHGAELEGGLQRPVAGGLTATGSYTYVRSQVISSVSTNEEFQPGQPLLRRPRHSAALRVAYSRGRATLTGSLRHVGDRHDASFLGLFAVPSPAFPAGRPVDITVNPGYTVIGVGGELRLSGGSAAFLRIENLANAAYETALGYPGLPRTVMAGLRVQARGR